MGAQFVSLVQLCGLLVDLVVGHNPQPGSLDRSVYKIALPTFAGGQDPAMKVSTN